MRGTVITDLQSISAGGAWGFTAPSAFYQAPAVERVVAGTARARVQDSADPIRPERPGVWCSWSTWPWGDRPLKSGSPLAAWTVAVSVPRRIGFAGASAPQVRRAADASAALRPAPAHRSAAIG